VQAFSQRYLTATQQLQSITKKSNDTEKQLSQIETETHRKQEDYIKMQNLYKIQEEELKKCRQGYLEIGNAHGYMI
jgi:chromosome segregation ATPase